jgi:hypothetical protein
VGGVDDEVAHTAALQIRGASSQAYRWDEAAGRQTSTDRMATLEETGSTMVKIDTSVDDSQ